VSVIALAATCAMAQSAIDNSPQEKTAAKPNMAINPYNGTWNFVLSKSHFSKASAGLRSLTVNVQATRSKFDWTATGEDSTGQEVALAYGGAIDRKPHPVAGNPNAATITYTRGANDALDATWKDAKGNIYGTQHLTLSADKKTITLTGEFKDPNGKKVTSTEVYDKAGGATAAAKLPETRKE
jgi:hypothetical protein